MSQARLIVEAGLQVIALSGQTDQVLIELTEHPDDSPFVRLLEEPARPFPADEEERRGFEDFQRRASGHLTALESALLGSATEALESAFGTPDERRFDEEVRTVIGRTEVCGSCQTAISVTGHCKC